jgi:hypothetical protein
MTLSWLSACTEEIIYNCPDVTADNQVGTDIAADVAAEVAADITVPVDTITTDTTDVPVETIEDTGPVPPTYWSAEATVTVDSDKFINVDGQKFFGLGVHANGGRQYDGVSGPGQCDDATGAGYININISKTHRAADEGANFVYLWGYGADSEELLDVTPRFKGIFNSMYGTVMPVENDVVPIIYNAFGEEDMEGFDQSRVDDMTTQFNEFITRTGRYSLESIPNLPAVEQVGHMAWHPTFRMKGGGDGKGEVLTDEQAEAFAKTTNMMIGDAYAYVENRYDLSDPGQYIIAKFSGQEGDIGEGYDQWIENDDPLHRSYFDSGFTLAHSLATRRNADAVVWMWIQGYAFGSSIAEAACKGEESDSWATGGFPPLPYMQKEVLSTIIAGATGIIFFGYPSTQAPEAEIIHTVFRALSFEEVYGPALLGPRLDLGVDTMFMGEEGYDGKGRAHLAVKWDETGRHAFIIGANPGARETTVELTFPWSLSKAEMLNWELPRFQDTSRVVINDRTIRYTFKRDEGVIIRLTPLERPAE